MANVSSFSGAMPVIPGGTVELGYSQITSNVTVDNATAGTGKEVIAPLTVVCDGGPILVEFYSSAVRPNATAGDNLAISLFEDGSEKIRYWASYISAASASDDKPCYASVRLSPSAGSHTYGVKAFVTNAGRTGLINANTGTANAAPAFLRVSKIVNQNDGLKPFWTPPVVTQLPSQATVGDQVIYAADATNGVYWHLQYDGLGTYPWKFIGGAPLLASGGSANSSATTAWQDVAPASITVPLAGDYQARWNGHCGLGANEAVYIGIFYNGASSSDANAGLGYGLQNIDANVSRMLNVTVTTAATTMKTQIKTTVAASRFCSRQDLSLTPVRVKAA